MYYYKNDHCNDSIFWLFYSEKCAKVQSHIARPKTSHTHAHRTHSFKPFPHALPHAHRTCGSAIIRTCAPQPNICLLRGSCTNKSQFFFYIYSKIYTVDFLFCFPLTLLHIQMLGCGAHVRKIALPHVRCACGKVFPTVRAKCVRVAHF